MIDVTELLSEIAHQGIQLSADGDQLNIRAPKGVMTSALAGRLTQHKAAILDLLRNRQQEAQPSFEITPDPQHAHVPFPLADIQKAYWVGRSDAMEMGNVGCHFYQEFDGEGLDLGRLEAAWQRLIERHGMLRVRVLPGVEQCIQAETPPYRIEATDLRGLVEGARETELRAIRECRSHRIFDLQEWPLFDIKATRITDQRTRLHVGIDLFIADAASIFQLFREWGELYRDPGHALQPLELTFRDYLLAERALRESGRFRSAEEYWRQRAETLPPAPDLPLAKRADEITQPRFVRRSGRLDAERWARLRQRGSQAGITPSALLAAVFCEVLAAWSKSNRFTLNVTLFNRLPLHAEVRDIVGDFTSTILLEAAGGADSFETRARRLQTQLAEDLNHAQVSGVRVLQEIGRTHAGEGARAMPIVFTSLLSHRNSQDRAASPTAWLGAEVFSISQTPQVWLDHHIFEEEGRLHFNWDAVEELFPAGVLDDMIAGFGALLARLADRDEAWKQVAMELAPERTSNVVTAPVSEGLLHSGFQASARRNPQQVAIASSRRNLTYQELQSAAAFVARRLRESGVERNTLVAVVMEKGWEQVAAVLGILQAGAAYLPVDAGLPEERRRYLLEHGQVRVAVMQSWLAALELPGGIERVYVGETAEAPFETAPCSPDDLAYVIYTSGSTGEPKGVMIDHRGAVNTIDDINRRFAVGPEDRVLALSSLSFDLSVYDIFGVLAAGGTIVIPEADSAKDPARWLECIRRERVTVWNSVPALMRMMVEYSDASLDSLRLVMLSGDWIPVSLPGQIRSRARSAEVISLGGATEASIWSILYPIDRVEPEWTSIPYGAPMTNQTFHVLNDRLENCPDWVTGRLFIGGVGLAKGYWRDEAVTARRFSGHPRTGERIYETGDLGRYLPCGNIEFLGREDFQVKVGGHRIELGEIESALLAHPDVRSAVVTVAGEARGDKRLIAYVVRQAERSAGSGSKAVQRAAFKLQEPGIRSEGLDGKSVSFDPALSEPAQQQYLMRRTRRSFASGPVNSRQIGEWLRQLMAIPVEGWPLPKYRYPSAGSLYPVQVYVHIKDTRVEGIEGGFYYYHPKDHRLVQLAEGPAPVKGLHHVENQPAFDSSAFSLFLVGELRAIEPLYGDLARDFCLLEAGYMSQLLLSAGPECGLALCPIGGMDFDPLRAPLRLGDSAILVHSMVGGGIAEEVGKPSADLRSYLKAKLPEHMVPSAFVTLDELPLTSNGKIDRKRLPAPEALGARPAEDAAPPSDLEHTLAKMAAEIFGLPRIGVHDNFFELGGTSLHLVQLQRRLRTALAREIAVARLFAHPTIASLAAFLAAEAAPPKFLRDAQERARKRRGALGQARRDG